MSRTGDDRSALPERAASGSSFPAREAPTRTAREALRRTHWLSAHRERIERARSARAGCSWSEAGDTLIEVLISATLMGIIVVATLSGLSSSSKATAVSRARAQADALAQQDEDYLRAEPIANLIKMNRTRVVTETGETYTTGSGYKGTIFTVHSVGEPKEETGTSTCSSNSANPTIPYIRTISEVTWGPTNGEKSSAVNYGHENVAESGIISPPPGTNLIVKVVNRKHEPVEGMNALAKGPLPTETIYSGNTNGTGCVTLPIASGGPYYLNVHHEGAVYVDENWYQNSHEDPVYEAPLNLVDQVATKKEFKFDIPGWLKASYYTKLASGTKLTGQRSTNLVAFSTEMNPKFKRVQRNAAEVCPGKTNNNPESTGFTSNHCLFPFTPEQGGYVVFPGTCEANEPSKYPEASLEPYKTVVEPEKQSEVELPEPSLIVNAYTGTKLSHGSLKALSRVRLRDTDTVSSGEKCFGEKNELSEIYTGATEAGYSAEHGALKLPGQPYGHYEICAEWEASAGKFDSFITKEPVEVRSRGATNGTTVEFYAGEPEKTPVTSSNTFDSFEWRKEGCR